MSHISYEEFEARKQHAQNPKPRVSYFALKNDKDEAIVRFMHDSPKDFEIVAVHPVTIDGKFRKVNCLRGAYEPIENCPLCRDEHQLQKRFYIHLIEYKKGENGDIIAQPKVWDRSTDYISVIKDYCDEYPPLSDSIFKIKRNGVAGSTDTTYSIMPANANAYPQDVYKKDMSLFESYSVIGNAVLVKSFDEINAFLNGEEAIAKPASTSEGINASQSSQSSMSTYNLDESVTPDPVANSPVRVYEPGTVSFGQENEPVRPKRLY